MPLALNKKREKKRGEVRNIGSAFRREKKHHLCHKLQETFLEPTNLGATTGSIELLGKLCFGEDT